MSRLAISAHLESYVMSCLPCRVCGGFFFHQEVLVHILSVKF